VIDFIYSISIQAEGIYRAHESCGVPTLPTQGCCSLPILGSRIPLYRPHRMENFLPHITLRSSEAEGPDLWDKAEYAEPQKFLVKLKSRDLAIEIAVDGFLRYGEDCGKARQHRLDTNNQTARCTSEHDTM